MTANTLLELITEKGTVWEICINNARDLLQEKFLSDKILIRLATNSDSPEEFSSIITSLYQDSKERPTGLTGADYFFKAVNYSIYPLKDWIKAVYYFNNWLLNEKRQASFLKQLGYLQCCEESPEHKDISFSFIQLLDDMLNQHGFIG
jgi:hypothetical protein